MKAKVKFRRDPYWRGGHRVYYAGRWIGGITPAPPDLWEVHIASFCGAPVSHLMVKGSLVAARGRLLKLLQEARP